MDEDGQYSVNVYAARNLISQEPKRWLYIGDFFDEKSDGPGLSGYVNYSDFRKKGKMTAPGYFTGLEHVAVAINKAVRIYSKDLGPWNPQIDFTTITLHSFLSPHGKSVRAEISSSESSLYRVLTEEEMEQLTISLSRKLKLNR